MNIEELSINTIRMLGVDATNNADSGHPGMVLGSAPIIYTLFTKHINALPRKSEWINRDRFVLASGHASMLQYATLHLCGYKVSIDDIKKFRTVGSITPGHPEYHHTDGIDCTSGPLGQGVAHATGMAMAEKFLAAKYNKDNLKVIDHYTYALCGDGDMQEGLTQEAISLAGHQKLNKLIVIYDSNAVTLDGPLSWSFSEDVKGRFVASGWNVIEIDGFNTKMIDDALCEAKTSKEKPTLIIAHTIIGYGSVNQGTNKVHGSPIGYDDAKQLKAKFGWDYPEFTVPEEVYTQYKNTFGKHGKKAYRAWEQTMQDYQTNYPNEYVEFNNAVNGVIPTIDFPNYAVGFKEPSRKSSATAINLIAKNVPYFIGGAADVAGSVNTNIKDGGVFSNENPTGRTINYGIREFAMSCAQSGILLHGGLRTYTGSFLVFSDYYKASMRLACLMKIPAIYVLTHDSIAIGEDGPTHEPIEQVSALRLIPGMTLIRPADANETMMAWKYAIENKNGPVSIVLTRQNITVDGVGSYEEFKNGAYVISKESSKAQYTVLASGSEVNLAIKAQKLLLERGIDVRVVSIPSTNLFNKLSPRKQNAILGNKRNKVIALELGSPDLLYRYASRVIGMTTYGASGKGEDVCAFFGFTPENIADLIAK